MSSPFHIFSWQQPFLPALKQATDLWSDGRPGDAVIIVPHNRPWRYLVDIYAAAGTTGLLPKVLSLPDMVRLWRMHASPVPLRTACLLDRVALLRDCVLDLADEDHELEKRFGKLSPDAFLPWGIRLANLLEELLGQNMVTDDLPFIDEVSPPAAALLGALGRIRDAYVAALAQKGWTTPGHDFWLAARHAEDIPDLLRPADGHPVLLAGFSLLTETEDILLRSLWQAGARVCLHTDPALARHGEEERPPVHWACQEHAQWLQRWQASARPWEADAPSPVEDAQKWHYFAGYDLHSQLKALQQDLDAPSEASTAILLTHGDLLLPVLHHLPRKDCNISLGYPLERSLLFRLLETVLEARNRRQPNGTTHWKTLADLVRHPYLRLLEANGISLRDIFQNMETRLRNGSRHADAHAVAEGAADDFFAASSLPNVAEAMPAIRELLNRILRDTVDTWARVHTLGGLADALSGLCDTLLVYGSGNDEDGAGNGKADIWSRFPIDAECLFRLMQRVIPALKDNGMADTPLPWPLMQAMLLELVRAERVPFEADPLTGLQVLGMLETRLLRFSRVFLVDVTDDRLPGAPIRSPLLPDSLRALLGLPDTRNREQLAAYTFHRLIAGADEVWLYWQEGVETSGLFDGKKQRSRLVEELIWQEEQARGQRLKPGREPLRTAALDVRPPVRVRKVVPKTPAIREQIAASLKHPLSATRLDAYLTCPLRYYYERLCAIAPIDEVNEDDDPAAVGVLLHNVLRDFYAPAVGKTVRRDAQSGDPELPFLDEKALRALFRTALDASGLEAALPPESAAMLSVTGPERLGMFLRAQPEQTEVLSLEEEYDAEIRVGGRIRRLTGNLDRVDWREQEDPEGAIDEGAVILDYKTGRIKALRPDIWADDAFWDALDPEKAAEAASEPDPEHDFLPIMAQRIPTVQLLYYCYLYGQATGKPVLDAAFVALGEDGGERPLFGKGMTIEERERALSLIPRLIGFILLHMELCPEFRPREGAHCRWCSWRNVCIISSQQ